MNDVIEKNPERIYINDIWKILETTLNMWNYIGEDDKKSGMIIGSSLNGTRIEVKKIQAKIPKYRDYILRLRIMNDEAVRMDNITYCENARLMENE